MELLSPAGSFAALLAAVSNGADAVYFGGSLFNARLNAQNFDNDEMLRAIDHCHMHGVKAYITMNTLTHDRDLHSAVDYAAFLYKAGVDALIIQDLGLFSLIKKYIPEFELHASTQMCISTLEGVRECEKMGYERVVLSRELSLSDISYIHSNSNMPLEVFVHGAMCMSFSGGCLFSSMVGGRSGNCGTCAQPCRKYAAIDRMPQNTDLALSLGDLCMIEHIKELETAGAISLKIEGRMKKPEYIASVTHAYRRAIDGADISEIAELKREMQEVFSRGEFTKGYYFGDGAHINRIASANPTQSTLQKIHQRPEVSSRYAVDMNLSAHVGQIATLNAKTSFADITVKGTEVEKAQKPITESTVQRYTDQLKKLGGTAFETQNVAVDMDGFLPVSAVNEMRRNAVESLENCLKIRRIAPTIPHVFEQKVAKSGSFTPKITARTMNCEQAMAAYDAGADEIVIEYGEFSADDIAKLQRIRQSAKLYLALPISLIGKSESQHLQNSISPNDFDGIEINNLGQLEFAKQFSHTTGGMHLNVFNAHTAMLLLDKGIERLTVSPELNAAQIREIQSHIPSEKLSLHVYGRVVLMNLYHCPIKESIGCEKCKRTWHTLYDADGRAFPITGTQKKAPCSVVRLYNCFPHDIISRADNVDKINYTLSFTTEDRETIIDRITCARQGKGDALPNTTRGYFKK